VRKLLSVLIIAFILLFRPETARAAPIFSDTFAGGYNSSWYVPSGTVSPVSSTFGITGANTTNWSVIHLPITENITYQIELDLKVNNEITNQAWGFGITNNTGAWKFVGNWSNLLQIHDSNGIDLKVPWDKTVGIHHFEVIVSPNQGTTFSVLEDNILLGSIVTTANFNAASVEIGLQGSGDYELANFVLSTYEEPTPTATPTETPTPSPTATPTSTPTDTPLPTPKTTTVILVPGYYNAYNTKLMMSCETGTGTEPWTPMPQAVQLYAPVTTALRSEGFKVVPFYYDWRKTPYQNSTSLNSFILANTKPDEKVHVLAHSFGGLVSRAYIEQTQENSRVDAMLAVGTPFAGTPPSYLAWAGGDLTKLPTDRSKQLLVSAFLHFCGIRNRITYLDAFHKYIPSLQQLLPTYAYLRDIETHEAIDVTSMKNQNNWLPNVFFPPPYFGIRTGTYTGTGKKTELEYLVTSPNRQETRLGLWSDGKPVKSRTIFSQDGDDTVLQKSAQLSGADNSRSDPLSHMALVSSTVGITKILDFFNAPAPLFVPLTQTKESDSAMMIVTDSIDIELEYPDGSYAKDDRGVLIVSNPKSGKRALRLQPRTASSRFAIGQILRDGRVLWRDYSIRGRSKRSHSIRFDETMPKEDLLE